MRLLLDAHVVPWVARHRFVSADQRQALGPGLGDEDPVPRIAWCSYDVALLHAG
jgi:hypothetical protein